MKYLAFSQHSVRIGTKRVRTARFDVRSNLPSSAACVVANGFRETLGSLLGAAVCVRLYEPSVPSPQAWNAIAAGAQLYIVRATLCDAAIVLRAADAAALAGAAFGESHEGARDLSDLETRVLERAVRALCVHLGAVCGTRPGERIAPEPAVALSGFTTYFEVEITSPVRARIGVALSRDPLPAPAAGVGVEQLAAVPLQLSVSLPCGTVAARTIATLRPGDVLPFPPGALPAATLSLSGTPLATGEIGVQHGQFALAVTQLAAQENH